MEKLFIGSDNIKKLLDRLARELNVVAPAKNEDGIIMFGPVADAGKVLLEYQNSTLPPKSFFFPQTERLFKFSYGQEGLALEDMPKPDKRVLFGVHPCDLKSILSLDPVFAGAYKDSYYIHKRENSTIIGLACSNPSPRCFCPTFGFGPEDGEGSDIMLTPSGNGFSVDILSDKGREIVTFGKDLFEKAVDSPMASGSTGLAVKKLDLTGVKELLDANFELEYWNQVFEKCLGCGICTYVCPTCHCFDIYDSSRGGCDGERYRSWDSCMFPHFTMMAGGHNPRPTKKERVRNRFMHKLKYHTDRYGLAGCVGCGRCVKSCPVNIDIRRIINDLEEVSRNGQQPVQVQ